MIQIILFIDNENIIPNIDPPFGAIFMLRAKQWKTFVDNIKSNWKSFAIFHYKTETNESIPICGTVRDS